MVVGVRPDTFFEGGVDGMPTVPGVLPGQDLEGGSECDFDVSADGSQVADLGQGSSMGWERVCDACV